MTSAPMHPRRGSSLERSLQWALGVLVLFVLGSITATAVWIGREAAQQFVASRLSHDADAIIAALAVETRGLERSMPPVFSQPFSGHYYVIRFKDGTLLRSRSLWDETIAVPALAPGDTSLELRNGPQHQRLLVWKAGYEKRGRTFTIAVAEDLDPILRALHHVFWIGIGLSVLSAVVLLLVQRGLLRRGFRQIDAVRTDVRRLAAGEIGRLREEVPAEVQPLVREMNLVIDAWQQHVERSRNALGNLAHALKAPLGLILQQSPPGNRGVADQALRMRELIDRELRRARLAAGGSPARRFRPEADCADLVASIRMLHADKDLEIGTQTEAPESLPFDQEDVLELLGNLLDNAAKWAERRVLLRVEDRSVLRIRVEDDGPGIDPEAAQTLVQRGTRLDETIPGHGLGLAIVGDIVRHYGGTLAFARSPRLGGLMVSVELPFAAAPA